MDIENLPKIVYDAKGNQYQVIDTQLFPIELDEAIENPLKIQQELYTLLIKAARRCAYDLNHASDDIPRDVMFIGESAGKMWSDRSKHWLNIFQPDGMKDYRHRLHREMDIMDIKIQGYQRILKENNIDDTTIDVPF